MVDRRTKHTTNELRQGEKWDEGDWEKGGGEGGGREREESKRVEGEVVRKGLRRGGYMQERISRTAVR